MGDNKGTDDSSKIILPYLSYFSFGGITGFCSGYALKKIGKIVALGIGLGFVSLQYYDLIQIKWHKFEEKAKKAMDLNGDGKVDMKDAKIASNKLMEVLQLGIPSTVGFGAGFMLGVKQG